MQPDDALDTPDPWPEFDRAMRDVGLWPSDKRVAVAVSGGPDSLALAVLAKRWGNPFGLIVDHGLREAASAEAMAAKVALDRIGVPCRILTLRGLHRGSGLACRARQARYRILAEAMAQAGLSDLLLGHHADDQAETVLMREQARSGPAGLAGMALVSEQHSHRLVRPLLGVRSESLRAFLASEDIIWVEDPSNQDPRALRSGLRRSLQADPARIENLLRLAGRSGASRATAERRIATTLAGRVTLHPEGYAVLRPGSIAADCLGALIRALAGAPYPPGRAALARMAAAPGPGTLGGVRFLPAGRLGEGLLLVREEAAMQPPIPALPGCVWDGRFRLGDDAGPPPGAMIGAFGENAAVFRDMTWLPAAVLRTLPAVRKDGVLLAVPPIGYFNGWTLASGGMTLSPPFPASGAPFAWLRPGDAEAAGTPHVA